MHGELQQILGTDKRNPCFTVFRDEAGALLLFYGGELLETLPDDRNHAQYKLMVAALYNAGVNSRSLQETFSVDPKTMRHWGHALEGGDPMELARVLAGRQANRKLTPEIQAYARMRFTHLYPENRRSYSQVIRGEISEVFGVGLSAESLRPIFGELREAIRCGGEVRAEKGETACDVALPASAPPDAMEPQRPAEESTKPRADGNPYRKESPLLATEAGAGIEFSHHLGILLFSQVLLQVERVGGGLGWVLKQWLCSILLGALNIEQSKLLDLDGLAHLIGRTQKSRHPQRRLLAGLASTSTADRLYKLNAELVGADSCNDFYYDPHTKQYTGSMKLLKGWCGSRHFADKALHMDFIHTAAGHPVHVSYDDNYDDLRTRYATVVSAMRSAQEMEADRVLTLVFDRGIYGQETFGKIIEDPVLHIVTWEKNYRQQPWDTTAATGHYTMHRTRNRANDLKTYHFEFQEEPWSKNTAMRLIRVRATNPAGRTIELGILADHAERRPQELIWLMFHRWLQENDFKYMEKHFGINQITSYASHPYEELAKDLEDRQIKSGEGKALQKERTQLRKKLKTELYNEHRHPGKSTPRTLRIETLSTADEALARKLEATDREASRLDTLIEGRYRKLNTASKQVYDALKLIARNAFYQALAPFKDTYDNYRDDHVLFRNLTRAPGLLTATGTELTATLYPTAPHPPARRKLIEELLGHLNQTGVILPDGSGRQIQLELGKKEGIELATQNP
jgi:hypothetical protein